MEGPSASADPAELLPPLTGLRRSLAARHLTMISMGGIIGAGLFVGSSAAIAAVGPAILASYAIAGVLILLVMRMIAEMAAARPEVRSFTDFARVGLGGPAGFVTGWLYWYFWVIVVPVEAIAGATLLQAWIPMPVWLLGGVLIAIMTAVNLQSARWYGEFEFWFSSVKVAAIAGFLALAAACVIGLLGGHEPGLANLVRHGGFAPHGALAVLAGVTSVFFSLTGVEIIAVAAAEARDPGRALTRMTTSVILRILVFYLGSMFLIMAIVPWDRIVPGTSPFTQALLALHFPGAGMAMSLVILTAVLSCLNSAFYVTSRVLFTLAARGDAPRWIVRLDPRGVPARSVLIGSTSGLLGILAATTSPARVFAFLVNASGALMLYVYLLTALAQIRLRSRRGVRRDHLQMWWYPWASYAAIAGMLAVLLAMASSPALASQFYVSLAALGLAAGACAVRQFIRR